jgi:hypothetical protein
VNKGIWAPRNFKKLAKEDALNGVYLPFWTYDAQTTSAWSGYGGRHYYETEYYTDSDGKQQKREVQRTEWIYRSGTYNEFFDDILIGASSELLQAQYESIFPFQLEQLVNFDAKYLSGWQAHVYNIPVAEGYEDAKKMMERDIYNACTELCRIDTYKDVTVETSFFHQMYKHVLLPVWICTYLYKQKQYRFLINGQTGKIHGRKPVSAAKITLVVLLAIIILIIILVNTNKH